MTQPDGGGLEGCGYIDFWSYRETSNWQDIPCSQELTGQFVCQQRAKSYSKIEGNLTHYGTTVVSRISLRVSSLSLKNLDVKH